MAKTKFSIEGAFEQLEDIIEQLSSEEISLSDSMDLYKKGVKILDKCSQTLDKTLFGKVLVMGIAFHISLQVLINVGVVLTIIPNTGASLPFISYGGSAVLFTLAEMGIALSVNRYHMRRSLQRKRAELEKEEEQ